LDQPVVFGFGAGAGRGGEAGEGQGGGERSGEPEAAGKSVHGSRLQTATGGASGMPNGDDEGAGGGRGGPRLPPVRVGVPHSPFVPLSLVHNPARRGTFRPVRGRPHKPDVRNRRVKFQGGRRRRQESSSG